MHGTEARENTIPCSGISLKPHPHWNCTKAMFSREKKQNSILASVAEVNYFLGILRNLIYKASTL